MLNVLDGSADDIQYAYASRLRGETSDGVDDVHFHPVEPRQVRLSIDWRLRAAYVFRGTMAIVQREMQMS